MKKSKLWQGLSGVAVFLFVLILSLTVLANSYAMLVNDALGLSTSGLTLSGSDYGGEDGTLTDEGYEELIADSYAFCIEEEEEGAVLLMNNGALPLEASERNVTLFGNNSAHTIYRSGAGGPSWPVAGCSEPRFLRLTALATLAPSAFAAKAAHATASEGRGWDPPESERIPSKYCAQRVRPPRAARAN